MTRRSSALLLLLLAAGLAYGWFVVPVFLAPAALSEEEHIDAALRARRQEAAIQLTQWLHEQEAAKQHPRAGEYALMVKALLALERGRERTEPDVYISSLSTPGKELCGTVTASTPAGDVVMIDIGIAAGLWIGRALDLRRPGPVPFHLGTVQVEQVWEDRAVARAMERCLPLRPGDDVGTQELRPLEKLVPRPNRYCVTLIE